jgi:hypothetical protein
LELVMPRSTFRMGMSHVALWLSNGSPHLTESLWVSAILCSEDGGRAPARR